MRLLITRPEPDASRTANALRSRGHEALVAPLLRIETLSDVDLGTGPWAALLITSINGARALAAHRRRAELSDLPVVAVGRASAAAAREAGFANAESAEGDSRDLVRRIAARFVGGARPLLHVAGEDRARDLPGELAAFGIAVRTVVAYRAVAATQLPGEARAVLEAGRIDGVLHFSRRSAEAYVACAADFLATALAPVHYCISSRTAEPLQAAGATDVRTAARPDEAALLELVGPA